MPKAKKTDLEDALRAAITDDAAERMIAGLPALPAEPLLKAWKNLQAADTPIPFTSKVDALALAARRGEKLSAASRKKLADALRALRDSKPMPPHGS
ncbi:MAG TPA: hypothetical protein VMB21_17375 [Candidatus Limnocylindria bacterium]|jgi:hypothetical protein|nr:hypothetical protein [Candidatus Limnocylindria bacterium]HTL66189.1 hypothetical protein [Lacunisphaera sp.]